MSVFVELFVECWLCHGLVNKGDMTILLNTNEKCKFNVNLYLKNII